jgi:YVTN family beta-propeller protein
MLLLLAATLVAAAILAPSAGADTLRSVLWVGNNWDGTADALDPQTFEKVTRLNIVPDLAERMAEIQMDPERFGYFLAIRQAVGEGHDQWVDDMFSSHDGRFLYVSRPSLADVVAFDLATRKIAWRAKVDGNRADHMAISPDGKRLVVSASTAKTVDVIDTATGQIVGRFPSGDQPHENNFSRDGSLIYHASIGTVYTPTDDPALDATKGERIFEIVNANTLQVLKKMDMGQKLKEAGYDNMSSAVRPMALSPDERYLYFQVSFFHGFVEYDFQQDKVLRLANLPVSEKAAHKRRDEYILDSAHHGLQMNNEGTKLCVAGTMDDYVAIVHRSDFAATVTPSGERPYWATNSADGRYCFVSLAGSDQVSVVSYDTEKEVTRIPVGDHPQRMRMGAIRTGDVPSSAPAATSARCVDRRKFTFRLRRIRGARIVRVAVSVNGKVIARKRGRNLRRVTLRRLPLGQFKVRIVTTHSNGKKRKSVRTYLGCNKSKPHTQRG